MESNTALVLGATGGIGGEMARQLRDAGWTVRALRRSGEQQIERRDAMNREDVLAAAEGCSVIVHAVNPPGYRRWGEPLREARRAGASALPARSARPAAGRVTRCRPLNRKRKQNPIRCGHDPAGLRSALCRDSVRNGYALSRCVAPRCRKPTHEPPICARSVPKAALARPLPTC